MHRKGDISHNPETTAKRSLSLPLITFYGLAAWGITESVLAAALMTLIEIARLVLFIWIGPPELTDSTDTVLAAIEFTT